MASQESVLVLGDHAQTLAVVRSLGRAGYRIVLGRERRRGSIAERSRCCTAVWRHPGFDSGHFEAELQALLGGAGAPGYLFPVGIDAITRIAAIGSALPSHVRVAAVPRHILDACVTKTTANEWAAAAGIRVPVSRVVGNGEELAAAARVIGFPLIVKTLRSEAPVHRRKAYLVNDEREFSKVFPAWPAEHHQLLVQRYVEGPLLSCDFVARDGAIVAYYQSESVRTDMPDGTGVAVEFRSQQPAEALFEVLRAFVAAHGYSGPGLLQTVHCRHTGQLHFIEINPRLSAGIAESVASGLDIPLITLRVARGDPLAPIEVAGDLRYRVGVTTHWLERDALGWIKQRKWLPARQRRAWLRRMIRAAFTSDGHINWQWRDPLPSLWILARQVGARIGWERWGI